MTIKVVDVFAGPGGLNEGFASFASDGSNPFQIVSSIEKDAGACQTLELRAAVRLVQEARGEFPREYAAALRTPDPLGTLERNREFRLAHLQAQAHVHKFRLDQSTREDSDQIIKDAVSESDPWVLIGGPPCQLYSLVGRARASRLPGFENDVRHVLYKEYLHIIRTHNPAAFVMENVKGMLSAMHKDDRIFDLIRKDIADLGYTLRSFAVDQDELEPRDFLIRTELYGVPQKRHRVILFGIRNDLAHRTTKPLEQATLLTVKDAIDDLPRLRSRVHPKSVDSSFAWAEHRDVGLDLAGFSAGLSIPDSTGESFTPTDPARAPETSYHQFVRAHSDNLMGVLQHQARGHMGSDISRYAYYSARQKITGEKLRVNDLPPSLTPNHRNVGRTDTPFLDRFRVQVAGDAATTVVSHIAKDGHYFIHYDPLQARSLSVREAARLQSFPDDYYFCGSRTEQYRQVGNAVPPFVAQQIAGVVHSLLT